MWHALGLFLLVGFGPPLSDAQLFSEGNARAWPPASAAAADEALESMDANQLAAIVDELRALRNAEQQQQQQLERSPYAAFDAEAPLDRRYANDDVLAKFGRDLDVFQREQAEAAAAHEANVDEFVNAEVAPVAKEQPAAMDEKTRVRPAAQKKGQFEFVEFVEPHHAKALKSVEYLDKRAPIASFSDDEATGASGRRLLFGSNNALFLVAVTIGSVATVVGVVGGGYYLNTVRKQRAEAFDDFTRYSPSGPGRDMLRKGRGFAGSPISEVYGDDALAKAAHLHHYTQTKQKIIGEDNGVNEDEHTDDEADDLEEQNYSIYECPGLAPTTGDIEVTNPNFAAQQP